MADEFDRKAAMQKSAALMSTAELKRRKKEIDDQQAAGEDLSKGTKALKNAIDGELDARDRGAKQKQPPEPRKKKK